MKLYSIIRSCFGSPFGAWLYIIFAAAGKIADPDTFANQSALSSYSTFALNINGTHNAMDRTSSRIFLIIGVRLRASSHSFQEC